MATFRDRDDDPNLGDAVDPQVAPRRAQARFERRRGTSIQWVIALALIVAIAGLFWGYIDHQPRVASDNPPAATSATSPGVPNGRAAPTPAENTGAR